MSQVKDAPFRSEAFRFVLRRDTSSLHEALDAHPALQALMAGTLDRDGYVRLMRLFRGFYAGADSCIAEACRGFTLHRWGFDYQRRLPFIEADLAALGAAPAIDAPETKPMRIGSAASLGGVLYVLEGSMLGGAALCEATETLLARTGARGNEYWRWCREKGGTRWATTCRLLEELASTQEARADMIASAGATFAAFARHLEGWRNDDATAGGSPC